MLRPAAVEPSDHQYATWCGCEPAEQPHQQRQHERGDQHVVDDRDRDHPQRLPDRDRRVVQQHPAEREDRGADERAGRDGDQRAEPRRCRRRAGPGRRGSRPRRARAPSGRRRGRPAGRGRWPARRGSRARRRTRGRARARRRPRRAAPGSAPPRRRRAARTPRPAAPRRAAATPVSDERRGPRTSAATFPARCRRRWITVRSLVAFLSTTTPTRSSEVKSTYGRDDGLRGLLARGAVDRRRPGRSGCRRRTARRCGCPR